MLRAVLFDLDGTLFDRATTVRRCVEGQHRRFASELGDIGRSAYAERFTQLDGRGYVKKDEVYGQLEREFELPVGTADRLYDDFYGHFHAHAVGFDGLHDLLAQIRQRGLRLAIITNGGEDHQKSTIEALGIGHHFEAILISAAEGVRKPEAEIFERAMSRLGVEPGDALFVGDHPAADIGGARSAGLRTVWKRDDYWGSCEEADYNVDHLDELRALLLDLAPHPHGGRGAATLNGRNETPPVEPA